MNQVVYLVDDDAAVRKALGLLLETLGFTVSLFEKPDVFLQQLQLLEPGVGHSGYTNARHFRIKITRTAFQYRKFMASHCHKADMVILMPVAKLLKVVLLTI